MTYNRKTVTKRHGRAACGKKEESEEKKKKKKNTHAQTHTRQGERKKNMHGAADVPEPARGENVL